MEGAGGSARFHIWTPPRENEREMREAWEEIRFGRVNGGGRCPLYPLLLPSVFISMAHKRLDGVNVSRFFFARIGFFLTNPSGFDLFN